MICLNSSCEPLVDKYRPRRLSEVRGQPEAIAALQSFVRMGKAHSSRFLLHGPTGTGKTAAAWALAYELGCPEEFPDLGGIHSIPSGCQDGRSVDELLRSLRFRPLFGSGWKVAIVNEADRMTENAETVWLDGLERLPFQTVVVFTTNEIGRLSDRLTSRCEIHEFSGSSPAFRRGLASLVRKVWKEETGLSAGRLPKGLGQFELASPDYSIRLALQQITPYLRQAKPLPESFAVPMIRDTINGVSRDGSAAAKKAWQTRRQRERIA